MNTTIIAQKVEELVTTALSTPDKNEFVRHNFCKGLKENITVNAIPAFTLARITRKPFKT
jgi:hypothetical protein